MVNMKSCALLVFLITLPYIIGLTTAAQCGWQASGRRCGYPNCCSQFGFCGTASQYCSSGCQRGYGYCWTRQVNQVLADAEAQAQAQAWAQTQVIEAQASAAAHAVDAQVQAQGIPTAKVQPTGAGAP